jgi:hypothetical protein
MTNISIRNLAELYFIIYYLYNLRFYSYLKVNELGISTQICFIW